MSKIKRLLGVILAASLVFSQFVIASISAAGETSTANAIDCLDDNMNCSDGSFSEWTGVPKNYFNGSTDEYFQLKWSNNRLYFLVVANDASKTVDSLNRDQIRLAVKLPTNEIALFYSDCDSWHQWNNADVTGWWGETGTTAVFQQDNTFTQFTYDGTKAYVEGSLNFADSYKSSLTANAQIGFSIKYYDGKVCTSTDTSCTHSAIWGDDDAQFTNDTSKFGTVTLAQKQASVYATGGTAVALNNTDTVAADGDLTEWGNVAKNYFASTDELGSYSVSSDEYFQVMWSQNRLYFAIVADDDGKTVDGTNRDQVRLAVKLPGTTETVSLFYGDADKWYQWNNTDVSGWWGETGTTAIFQQDSTYTTMAYSDGKVYIEGSLNFADSYKSYLAANATIGFAIAYYDNVNCTSLADGNHCAMWGDDDHQFTNDTSKFGTITLSSTSSGGSTDDGEYHTPLGVYATDINKGSATIDGVEDVIWKNIPYADRDIENNFICESVGWGQTDTTGRIKMMWDDNGLYFWVEVTDSTKNTTSTSGQISDKDSIILYVDQNNDDDGPYGTTASAKTGTSPWLIGASGECYGSGNGLMSGASFNASTVETDTGYIYEVFIGWTISDAAAEGNYIGVDCDINDNMLGESRNAVVFWNTWTGASGNWNIVNGYADGHLTDTGLADEPTVLTATSNAPTIETPVTLSDGISKKLTWSAVTGTYEYQINLFSLNAFDANDQYFVKTYKVYDGNTYTITDLQLDTDYVYQILAYDENGTLLSVSNTSELSTATDIGDDTTTTTKKAATTTKTTAGSVSSANTGVGLPMGMIVVALFALLCAACTCISRTRKKIR